MTSMHLLLPFQNTPRSIAEIPLRFHNAPECLLVHNYPPHNYYIK